MQAQSRKVLFQYAYARSPDQDAAAPKRHPVVIIGAGPVGLTLAIDLAQRGVRSVLIDDADRIGEGSRAICFAKRTLEIFAGLGVAGPMLEKGVRWQIGKVFSGEALLYEFNLLPDAGHVMPAFINLQQYYVEKHLVDRALALPQNELRWKNRLVALDGHDDAVMLTIDTPEGQYRILADHVVACDGARSPTRGMLGLDFAGEVFADQFLIADVRMHAEFPTERWFWFEPPFHNGQSALLHRQPDDIWRIDLQLDRDADTALEQQPERVIPRIERMLGHERFELEWVSIYRFQCRKLERFIHGRVIFAGDAAHQVSPFGARGANSGVQDADNLGWKLAAVLRSDAPSSLLETYDLERRQAADENIRHSTQATDFLAPRSPAERLLRDAVLALAPKADFARRMVNSGRLSAPTTYESKLSSPDEGAFKGGYAAGESLPDLALLKDAGAQTSLGALRGSDFCLLHWPNCEALDVPGLHVVDMSGAGDVITSRFDAAPGTAYLVRPDGHVAARFKNASATLVQRALRRASGLEQTLDDVGVPEVRETVAA
ncbi:MAG: FAD-dependent oxidoreductase [Beijerinckiaceae bacterium]|nr:FAD-dependent oxidoreductase [Beijerinckiaceae bacterium]